MSEQIRFYDSLQPQPHLEQPKPIAEPVRNPNYYYCLHYPDCPCIFANSEDRKRHMDKFSWDRESHLIKWHDAMERREAGLE